MNRAMKIVSLVAALAVALAACTPAESVIGPEVTGTVEGYDGPAAAVVVMALTADPSAPDGFELGTGTVNGNKISFTLKPVPEAALAPLGGSDVSASDPEARGTVAVVLLRDGQGGFQLGRVADPTEPTVGDALGFLAYSDRPVTLTAVGESSHETYSGSASLRQGWNVFAQTYEGVDEYDMPIFKIGGGRINDFDWHYTGAPF